jgi:drug/metabolite transporter (DMT)-like permease
VAETSPFAGVPARWKVVVAFAAVYVVWGSTYLAIRFAIDTLPPFLMAGVRFLVAGAVLFGFARLRGAAWPSWAQWRSATLIGGMLLLGGNGGVVWAERTVPSGIAALLVASEPLWIVLLDWLPPRPARPSGRVLLGLGVGFAGVALLIAPWEAGAAAVDPVGAIVIVLAAASWAAGSLYSRRAELPRSPLLSTGTQMLAGGALLTLTGLGAGEAARFDPAAVSLGSVAALAYLIVFGSLVAFTAYVWLMRHVAAPKVATYAYVNPVIAVILGWLLAGEPIGARTLVAAAVILGAVALLTVVRRGGVRAKGEQAGAERAEGVPTPLPETGPLPETRPRRRFYRAPWARSGLEPRPPEPAACAVCEAGGTGRPAA